MSKMRYFNNKFSKFAKHWGLCAPSTPLISDFDDLKLSDLPKSVFSTVYGEIEFNSYDVISVTPSLL